MWHYKVFPCDMPLEGAHGTQAILGSCLFLWWLKANWRKWHHMAAMFVAAGWVKAIRIGEKIKKIYVKN